MTQDITALLLDWYEQARRDLPWRHTSDPYRIWVSEIMLQQTRVDTVLRYYERFLELFPSILALALAEEEAVLKAWEGLGYYSRARNLHRGAAMVLEAHEGRMPASAAALRSLPGIGEYTAGAVASIAYGERVPAVDGNVERVLSRLYGVREDLGIPSVRRRIRELATGLLPEQAPGDLNQALMELGALVCLPAQPKCLDCPLHGHCDAHSAGDANELPLRQPPQVKRTEDRNVALIFSEDRVYLRKRQANLLKGLWEFPSFEGQTAEQSQEALCAQGLAVRFVENAGMARHIFTHLVWEMRLLIFQCEVCDVISIGADGGIWADVKDLTALPIPTAFKAARALAAERLSKEKPPRGQ